MKTFIETHYIKVMVSMAIFSIIAGYYTDEVLAILTK